MCFITERLPLEACAKISDMRAMVWDPEVLLDAPGYDAAKYSSVDEYGMYIMGGKYTTVEDFMFDLAVHEEATADLMSDHWEDRRIVPARFKALEADEGDGTTRPRLGLGRALKLN